MQEGDKVVISEQDFRRRFVYDHTNLLGEGGFAKVYQAYDRQFDETVALKFYTNTDAQKYDIISEMRNSRRFTHKNIIRVHDARIVRFTNSFGISEDVQVGILEYANAGNFQDFLKSSPSKEEFKAVIKEILQGLHYLHTEKRVIHRDLSPDNILMVKERNVWTPKIADFGISKEIDLRTLNVGQKKASSELVGKMEYMAPEQFDPKKYGINQKITTNVDLWSFGVILTEVFTDKSPFGDRNTSQSPMEIMHNVLHNPLPAEIKDIPDPYKKMIKSCLVKDAKKRAQTSLELIEILETPLPPPQSFKKVWLAASLILIVILAIGAWYMLKPDENNIADQKIEQNSETEKEPSRVSLTDSTFINPLDTIGRSQNTMEVPVSDKVNSADVNIDTSKVSPPLALEDSLPAVKPLTESEKRAIVFQNLSQKIKSLDNDIINLNLRRSRISNYINECFVSNDVMVTVNDDGTFYEEKVEDFMKNIVSTAGIEEREWKIDTLQTTLDNDKISTLFLRKY